MTEITEWLGLTYNGKVPFNVKFTQQKIKFNIIGGQSRQVNHEQNYLYIDWKKPGNNSLLS